MPCDDAGDTGPRIADYALIGDCHGAALVGRDGAIDWCALLRFDADPTFFRLLDPRGGRWTVEPDAPVAGSRAYRAGSAILRTTFETETGVLEVEDFMPVGRTREAGTHDYVSLNAPGWLVRRFTCRSGRVSLTTRFSPRRAGFDCAAPGFDIAPNRICVEGGLTLWRDGAAEIEDGAAVIRYDLAAGESETCVLTQVEPLFDPREKADALFAATEAFWREWTGYSRYRGRYAAMVERSALTLKLLTYAPTGAIVAAPTTSLPEQIGGARNWDYRYSWVRDAAYALLSLSTIGYAAEGRRFAEYLSKRCLREGSTLQILYDIDGDPFPGEREIEGLEGYRGSRPVRVGNAASDQRQLDVFGALLDWAHLRATLGVRLTTDEKGFLRGVADHVAEIWEEPDQGLWEFRGPPQHFTQGKAMAWVTLDRAARLLGDRPGWRAARDGLIAALNRSAETRDPPALAQTLDGDAADAALLQLPMLGLPLDDGMLAATVARVEDQLGEGDLVYRYRVDDGLEGGEGAFLMTSFWLAQAKLCLGRAEEARALFESLLARANDVGLYPEQIDAESGDYLGNFPQAFTHLAAVSTASMLDLYEREGAEAVRGSNGDRARAAVGATEGAAGLFYALLRNGRVRLRPSHASVLALC
jgi:GH15 family glucan-1,4-alpha-glucosidase